MTEGPSQDREHDRDEAHRFLDWARRAGAELDNSDESVWFIHGALQASQERPDSDETLEELELFAYAVYLAELLEKTCPKVTVTVDRDEEAIREVHATGPENHTYAVLSWVRQGAADPLHNNIVVKYADALRNFGETDRANELAQQIREYQDFISSEGNG